MGYALAAAALTRGHEVTLITGPVTLKPPVGAEVVFVETALEMSAAVLDRVGQHDGLLMCAAVADYRPAEPVHGKREKTPGDWILRLVRNPDILLEVEQMGYRGLRLGFAAEYGDPRERGRRKMIGKNLDLLAANDISRDELGIGAVQNAIWLLDRWGGSVEIGPAEKIVVAMELIQHVEEAILRLRHDE
jgi:phosphopantothenoylcysteine decarboxylase/phosphopantothenate--cysteine ligase